MPQRSSQSGVSLGEYGLVLASVVCICIVAVKYLGSQVSGNLGFVARDITQISLSINSKKSSPMPPGKIPNLNNFKSGVDVNPYPAPIVGGTSQSAKLSGRRGGNNRSFIDGNGNVQNVLTPELAENKGATAMTVSKAPPP